MNACLRPDRSIPLSSSRFVRRLVARVAVLSAWIWSAAALPAADSVSPQLSLSLRGVRDAIVEQGEPVAVAIRIALPARAAGSVELAPASGTWCDAVQVEIARDATSAALVRGAVVGRPESPRVVVAGQRPAGGLWLVPGSAMQGLAPGSYLVRARLVVETGSGWRGQVQSPSAALTVVARSAQPKRISQRVASEAFEASARGRDADAAAVLDSQLKLTPQDRDLLLLRAALCEKGGNIPAALALVNRSARVQPVGSPPPSDFHVMRTRLQARLLQGSDAGELPAWSDVPRFLLPAADATSTAPVATAGAALAAPTAPTAPAARPPMTGATASTSSGAGATPAALPTLPALAGSVVPAREIKDADVRADPAGQWAAAAQAKSSYSNPNYGPAKATGAPNIDIAGDSVEAWCPGQQSSGMDWLEVTFARPVKARGVRVRQNQSPGAITKVEAIAADGRTQVWWEGQDPYIAPPIREIAWFGVDVPPSGIVVEKIRLTLDLARVPGWKQIDAVQLLAAPP